VKLAKRHPGPFVVALAATLLSVGLAIGPNWDGAYDPTLAVLCATLIAIVWYTFFSYCALHPSRPVIVKFHITHSGYRSILVHASNQDSTRPIECRWRVLGWRNKAVVDTGAVLGKDSPPFTLRPGEQREQNFGFPAAIGVPGSRFGPRVELGEPEFAVLRTDFIWSDEEGNEGYLGPDYYAVEVLDVNIRRYVVVQEGEKAWRECGGASEVLLTI